MSLIQRQPRPVKRNTDRLRDDRLFIVACDDTFAPKQYFDFFQITRIHVYVVPTEDGSSSAPHVLTRLLEIDHEEDDELWMLLDTDHCTAKNHLKTFIAAIHDAKQRGVKVALSKSCFEVWLLLHHVDETAVKTLKTAKQVEKALRKVLSSYNKTRLDPMHFPFESVVEACRRAERLDSSVSGGDIPDENTSRVYLLWKAIVAKALRSQLPPEFHKLLDFNANIGTTSVDTIEKNRPKRIKKKV
jgi:hypothetical protein